ncbi:uncharacterized protein OCT59_020481 [Rhizophagus irregularis]|uniref:uncharacterized protein n=1 Tax=Rhizophagus irregularis TaxID=588596 RepID=UPI003317EC55|nr:hypothetical protein OCT59_020481 [Rhizophagus irregularis]
MIENRKDKDEEYKALILYIINDPIEFLKFGSEILKVVINEKNDFIIHIIQLIFDKIIELIKKNSADYSYMALISLYLPKLCDHYSHLVTKYIIYTSIPICLSIKNSTNTSLHAYSNNISIEKSIPSNNSYIKRLISFYKSLTHHLKIKEEIISFIIPFPQICKYQDNNYNNWNEILYKPKPILFYNIDTNNFYKWWNFAAIIDFKWKIFEKIYYLIWLIYTIFFLCFALASTLEQDNNNILFIISILLGFIHLTFEIRQCLWNPKFYFTDLWNLFVLFLIISGFAHAFFILLKPNKNDDDNSINPDGTTLIQSPNSNTNMFSLFPTSLLAICNKKWFPDWIHYDIPVNKVYKLINAIDNNRTEFNSPPFISNRLRNLLKIPEPINENKSFEELKQQMRDEFKQQIKDMQELLNSFIKNSNTYHVNTK